MAKFAFALLSLLLIGGFNRLGFAQGTIHVPADASSIQAAIDSASNGDTILVAPGTYNENIDFKGKAITVTSGAKAFTDPAVASTIINGTKDGPVVVFDTNETSAAVLNGVTIQNGHAARGSGVNGGGISISRASPTITNNIVTNNRGCGVFVYNAGGPLIQGNDIKNSQEQDATIEISCLVDPTGTTTGAGASSGTGVALIQAGDVQMIGNTIENNVQDPDPQKNGTYAGIDILNGGLILIENNTIRNNNGPFCSGVGEAIGAPPQTLLFVQNLIYGNGPADGSYYPFQVCLTGTFKAPYPTLVEVNNTIYGGGESIGDGFSTSSVIDNNIFFNTATNHNAGGEPPSGLWCGTAGLPFPTPDNNDIFNAGGLLPNTCPLGNGNLSVDPQFLNPGSNDFHTQPTSPVVAAGDINASNIPPADLDGKARTVDGTIDMGVYEIRPHPPIALTALPNPAPGQSTVTLTAVVTGNQKEPTGTITFLDGATVLGTAPLNGSGVASFSTSFLFVGTHTLTATYPGDFNFENSTSNTITEVITGPPTTTVLNTVGPNPAKALQPVTMTAIVSSAYTVPTGNITFMAGGTTLATVPVNAGGIASATVSTLAAGTYTITAVYGGSTQYGGSTSNPVIEKVIGVNTATSLSTSPNPAAPGQTVTLAAQVSGAQSGSPLTGSVTFKDGAATIGAANVGTNGIATLGITTLLTGTHSITASYSGAPNYDASASGPITLVITGIPTSVGLNVSPNPATAGQTVTLVATAVAMVSGQVPSGTITFSDQSGVLGASPLVAGVASYSTSSLSVGTHQITATLNPAAGFAPSTSAAVSEVVNDFNFSISVSPTSLTLPSGDYETLTVTLTPSGGFADAIKLGCNSVPDHAQCVFNPTTSKPLSEGTQTVQLTVNTSDVFGYGNQIGTSSSPRSGMTGSPLLAGVLLSFVPACWLMGFRTERGSTPLRRLLLVIVTAALGLSLQACSGKLPGETAPGTYTIIVTATDAGTATSLTRSVNLPLTVKAKP